MDEYMNYKASTITGFHRGFTEEAYLLELREKGHEFIDWFVDREMRLLKGKIRAPADDVLEWLNTYYRITIEQIERD